MVCSIQAPGTSIHFSPLHNLSSGEEACMLPDYTSLFLLSTSRHYTLLTTTWHNSTLLNSFAKKKAKKKKFRTHHFPTNIRTPPACRKTLDVMLPHTTITQLSPFRHTAHLSSSTFTSHTPSHTHCIKPYLSVDLYTERSGSSQSSITAPSSRPCGFHGNRITMT